MPENDSQNDHPQFAGFVPPTRNFFLMPNEWTDITSEIDSLAELKVVEYVLRHTWGFHEYGVCKTISIDEFMYGRKRRDGTRMDKGTGLKSDRSVRDGLKLAIEHGYLACEIDESDKARVKKSYALNMRKGNNLPARVVESTTRTPGSNYQSAPTHLPVKKVVTTSRSKKDTSEKHSEKERENPNESAPPLDASFSLSLLQKMTDEQGDFWQRWCAFKKCSDQALTEKDLLYVATLAPKIRTTEDLLSLYDLAYEGLQAFATSQGREANPPELYNLVKVLPKWEQMQARKQQERDEARKQTEHIPGTGNMQNWTEARLRGEAPPAYTAPLSPAAQRIKSGNISAESLPTWLREKLKNKPSAE